MEAQLTNAALPSMPLFSSLDEESLQQVRTTMIRRRHATGETIFDESRPSEGLVIIADGSARLSRKTPQRRITLADEQAIAMLATPGLLDGGSNCVTAVALTDCEVRVLPGAVFHELCRRHARLMTEVLAALSRHMRQTTRFADLLTLGAVRQRLACLLLQCLAEKGTPFVLPWSQEEMAIHIGTVREVVSRTLRRMQQEGALHFKGRSIAIDDPDALRCLGAGFLSRDFSAEKIAGPFIPLCVLSDEPSARTARGRPSMSVDGD